MLLIAQLVASFPASSKTEAQAREGRLRQLVDAHYDAVWRVLRRLGVPSHEADDAAQRVFVVTARRLEEIQPARECAYIMGIAVRTASEIRRTLRRRREDAATDEADWPDVSDSPEALLDRKRARALLDAIVSTMPLELRTIFVLRELEGLSLPEIAAMQAIPLGTATSRLRRARELFRKGCANGP
jgi:RNA polymerase sigma-70 factor (ECF subfamily)